jgi:plastocyanin
VSFDNDGPHSPTQASGSWSMRFDTPGTYTYRCTIHNNMVGKVVVRSS